MRLKRIVAGIITGGLLGLAPTAVTPAQADTVEPAATVSTSAGIKIRYPYKRTIVWGQKVNFDGSATAADGIWLSNDHGDLKLQRKIGKGPWRLISTSDYPSDAHWPNVPATRRNTYFRAFYTGGVDTLRGRTLAPSASRAIKINVRRRVAVKTPTRGTRVTVRVAPSYKRGAVFVYKKVGKRWKKFRTLRTNKRSRLSYRIPAYRKRTQWKFVTRGNARLLPGHSAVITTYRTYYRSNSQAVAQ